MEPAAGWEPRQRSLDALRTMEVSGLLTVAGLFPSERAGDPWGDRCGPRYTACPAIELAYTVNAPQAATILNKALEAS